MQIARQDRRGKDRSGRDFVTRKPSAHSTKVAETMAFLLRGERRGIVVAVAGAAAGVATATADGDVLSAVLHGLSPRDPIALVAAPAATILGVVIAVAVPAWRASRVDPIAAIRDAR
jgi:hypothetical protein